jgi:hypothetical protein
VIVEQTTAIQKLREEVFQLRAERDRLHASMQSVRDLLVIAEGQRDQATQRAEAAEAERDALRRDACAWRDDEDGNWDTGCGTMWSFIDGGPIENGVCFCFKCGKPVALTAALAVQPTTEATP